MTVVEKLRDFVRWNRKYATDESKLQLSDDIEKVLDVVEAATEVHNKLTEKPHVVFPTKDYCAMVDALKRLEEARRG